MELIWKPIKGYEGLYEISSDADIRVCIRTVKGPKGSKRVLKQNIKKPALAANGYMCVSLWKENVCEVKNVHVLMAEAFIPNPNNYPFINHKDGDKTNNSISNLEWCTQKHNVREAFRIGLIKTNKPLICNETGEIFPSTGSAARKMGLCQSSVSACCLGRINQTHGFTFRYLEKGEGNGDYYF